MLLFIPVVAALPVAVLAMLSLFSRRPSNLGPVEGRLAPCPASPNCVATQSGDRNQRMAPLSFEEAPAAAMERLKKIIAGMPRSRIARSADNYLHVEFTSAVFRFVDDVEFLIDPATREIHFRSASRVGYSDLGANRRRMEEVRRRWEK
jgi:uncharacterized protein (DUF1499 family)